MEVRSVECPGSQDELWGFLAGKRIAGSDAAMIYRYGPLDWNRCEKLTVDCAEGVFTAAGDIRYEFFESLDDYTVGGRKIVLRPYRCQFESKFPGETTYWVLPLYNFISAFRQQYPVLDNHPLRVSPAPQMPQRPPQDDAEPHVSILSPWNPLIVFQAGDSLGFVEPLPNYEKLADDLLKGHAKHHITTIMVGYIAPGASDSIGLEQWLPLCAEHVLGLATGAWVGAPWMEFRDANGRLVRRLHIPSKRFPFANGHGAIDEYLMGGTGNLLSKALSSEPLKDNRFRAAIGYSIRAGLEQSLTVEDRIMLIVRGIECLCRYLRLNREDLLAELDQISRGAVEERVKIAACEVEAIVETGHDRAHQSNTEELGKRIAQRVRESTSPKARGFGSSVVALLNHYGFPDKDVAEAYYTSHPELENGKWPKRLTKYRASVFHEGFLGDMAEARDAFRIFTHLHDILLRCILKELGYAGDYQPVTIHGRCPMPVDWVKSNTEPANLGYDEAFRQFT